MNFTFKPAWFLALAFSIAAVPALVLTAQAGTGSVGIQIYKAGFIVGVSGGSGTLRFGGKDYALKIGGVSLGATIGASKAELIGTAENINKPSDIAGTYTAVQAGLAAAGGAKTTQLKNSKGVILKLKGKQVGLEFSLDLSGMQISLK
jgi:hypothetical protein